NVIDASYETRPPMLEKGIYDSWKTQILLYIKGKENGEMLIDSIKNEPVKLLDEITVKDAEVDIYNLINHYHTIKEIWDRAKELMKGLMIHLIRRSRMIKEIGLDMFVLSEKR
nr:integrase, catalytic region, zinc finger, CCHC-type, peptidase aspartic, catalytic [Tanacetum cinerariifolium]